LFVESSQLQQSTQYSMHDLQQCLRDLVVMVAGIPTLPQQAVKEKYKDVK